MGHINSSSDYFTSPMENFPLRTDAIAIPYVFSHLSAFARAGTRLVRPFVAPYASRHFSWHMKYAHSITHSFSSFPIVTPNTPAIIYAHFVPFFSRLPKAGNSYCCHSIKGLFHPSDARRLNTFKQPC